MNDIASALDPPAALVDEDEAARADALDPRRSFIVQAPAGSGKTALLIQRFLVALARAERPESVLAMTFTRKAAAEMQARVLEALASAARGVAPASAHDARTHALAREVLARDAKHGWNLLEHGARLKIQTIDAFCASLMRQAPLASGFGALPRFVDDARPLYQAAALAALRGASRDDAGWRRLLEHLDNDADRTVSLLAEILERREQWLRHLVGADRDALRASLEQALAREIADELARVAPLLSSDDRADLARHLRYAMANVASDTFPADLRAHMDRDALPPAHPDMLAAWRAFADWLLKAGKPDFRKTVSQEQGFPSKASARDAMSARQHRTWKASMCALLARLAATPGLAEALHNARKLPPPVYDEAQWSFVSALIDVLPRLAAELKLTFAEAGTIDFAEATLAAIKALGDVDAPSDLLLAIDMRLEHILVDEFQDTSYAQFRLLELLTSGWQAGDGRTLFVVGDPMQSIYRFRDAEVALFSRAAYEGVGGVELARVQLRRNFRAQRALVDWVNETFARVLGARNDAARRAIAFAHSVASRERAQGKAAFVHACRDDDEEAARVIECVREEQAREPGATIAVLVRARTHLDTLLPALERSSIAFEAVELDILGQRQAVLDLVSLTHAIVQPIDRLAWLAILRAPWCGLTLSDLLDIASEKGALWNALRNDAVRARLSDDGAARVERFVAALASIMAKRGRVALATLVRGAWLALGGPACIAAQDAAAAQAFFDALSVHGALADCDDWAAFLHDIDNLRARAASAASGRVQLMTLHKAKGLEFDVVLLPGLARGAATRDRALLRSRERPPHGLLLAPMKARATSEPDLTYEYLENLARDEEDAELARLLYVGATRSRERLHLFATLEADADGAPSRAAARTALAKLWPAVGDALAYADGCGSSGRRGGERVPERANARDIGVPLVRLASSWRRPEPPRLPVRALRAAIDVDDAIVFDWAKETARHIGTVAHARLREIGAEGLASWDAARVERSRAPTARELAELGVDRAVLDDATRTVESAIRATLGDARGRWLFAAEHRDARSEFALTGIIDDALVSVVIDRTFVDRDGVRWIVDFKLSTHEGGNREGFIARERERYAVQLATYATLFAAFEARPVRVGLYFPRLAAWCEWDPGTRTRDAD